MLNHLYLFSACIFSVELFLKLNLFTKIKSLAKNGKKVFHIILTPNISDHWKENMVPIYALILFKNSIYILVVFFSISCLLIELTFLSNHFLTFLLSFSAFIESIIISCLYLRLKNLF